MAVEFNLGDWVSENAGTLIKAGIGIVGSELQQSQNRDAAAGYNASLQQSSDILKKGYDEQLGAIEQGSDVQRQYLDAALRDTADTRTRTGTLYSQDVNRALDEYRGYIAPQTDEYGNRVIDSAGQYGQTIMGAAGAAGDIVGEGAEQFEALYDPYTETGMQALQYTTQILGMNPEEMDPGQRRAYEDFRRNAFANLARSGMRGAGRAGIAAVNEGEAELAARFYDQNRDRRDEAACTLMNQGYTATGQVAGNKQSVAGTKANLLYNTSTAAAGQNLTAANEAARSKLAMSDKIGSAIINTGQDVASKQYETGKDVTNLVGDYYGNVGNVEGARYQARGTTALGKAASDSAAAQGVGATNFNTTTTNAGVRGEAIGSAAEQVWGALNKSTGETAKKEKEKFVGAA